MRSFKVLAAVAVAGLVSVGAAAGAAPAHVAGGDAGPPLYPSIVNVPMIRAEAALQRAEEYADTAQADKAIAQLTLARAQMRKAWTGAKYVIDTAPPPVAGDGAFGRASGGALPGASPYADQYTTAGGVLSLQHDVAATAMGLLDSASGTLMSSLSSTIFAALNTRDTAIAYIHTKDVPAAPAGEARASGGAIAGWATTMQAVNPQLDDEMQFVDGTIKAGVSGGAKKILNAAEAQDLRSERTINTYWPPLPPG